MKEPHLLRVDRPASAFAPLIAAARTAGMRVGWLELAHPVPPPSLEEAARLGVLRSVAVGGERALAVKPRQGPAVLRDVLREYFLGCRLVLIRGDEDLPRLEPVDGDWQVTPRVGPRRRFQTAELVAALQRPQPWQGH